MASKRTTAERALEKLTDEELRALVKEAEGELEAREPEKPATSFYLNTGPRIIEPESVCPWCKAPAKYVKSRSDHKGRNTGTHVFYCRTHGWYESKGGNAGGRAIRGSEV